MPAVSLPGQDPEDEDDLEHTQSCRDDLEDRGPAPPELVPRRGGPPCRRGNAHTTGEQTGSPTHAGGGSSRSKAVRGPSLQAALARSDLPAV